MKMLGFKKYCGTCNRLGLLMNKNWFKVAYPEELKLQLSLGLLWWGQGTPLWVCCFFLNRTLILTNCFTTKSYLNTLTETLCSLLGVDWAFSPALITARRWEIQWRDNYKALHTSKRDTDISNVSRFIENLKITLFPDNIRAEIKIAMKHIKVNLCTFLQGRRDGR